MSRHLLEQTLPQDKADLAAYYARTTAPALAGGIAEDVFAQEAARLVREGVGPDDADDALRNAVRARHEAFVERYLAGLEPAATQRDAYARLAEYTVASDDPVGEMDRIARALTSGLEERIGDLEHRLTQAKASGLLDKIDDVPAWRQQLQRAQTTQDRITGGLLKAQDAASYRHDKAVENMLAGREGRTVAEPRRDMHPALAERLGLSAQRAPTEAEIARLLNGQRADGGEIEGRRQKRAVVGLDVALGLDPTRAPTTEEIGRILDGKRSDGARIDGPGTDTARARFLSLMGTSKGEPDATEVANLRAGRMADGTALNLAAYGEGVAASSSRIGYVDLTFSADKSLSVAWAFAPTEAERALMFQAHRDAVDATMSTIAQELGHARRGAGGSKGREAGEVGWVSFDHYTARPTVEVARVDAQGRGYTELATLKAAGDPQLHTHTALLNVVLTESGRLGSIDLDAIAGRVKEWGALYQAHVATNLRRHGVEVALDKDTGAARLTAVPASVRTAMSKRTRDGTEAAREYAAELGLDWDTLAPERRIGLLKEGTQRHKLPKGAEGTTGDVREKFEGAARKDDLGDFAAWQRQAAAMGYVHRSVLRPDAVAPALSRAERLEIAREASLDLVDTALQRVAKLDARELRVMAARGLVASGVEDASDIDAITKSFRERGVRQNGQDTAIAWGHEAPVRGKERVGVTTALHESQEHELVRLARMAAADRSTALTPAAIGRAVTAREAMPVENGGLRFGSEHGQAQRAVMDRLGSGGRFAAAVGAAGAGKSALLRPLVDAWHAEGRRVYGAALAWRQSDDLVGAGIARQDRMALDAFLRRVERGKLTPDRNSVVVVDELGLLGTRQLLTLLRLRERHGFGVVAVGDDKQSQSVEAGPVIRILRDALGAEAIPELLGTVRQSSQRERETAGLFREGRADEALARKREDGTALLVPGGYADAVRRTAELWRERVTALGNQPGRTVTVSAPTNADARAIGAAIREQRRAMGQVGADAAVLRAQDQNGAAYDLPLAVGDRVRLFDRTHAHFADKGTHGAIGNNGSVLEVRAVTADGVTLRTAEGRDGTVAWRNLRDKQTGRIRLSYGDALTIDAAQGLTSTEHINAMPAGTAPVQGFKAYVAESRHRERSWLVVSDGAERREVSGRRALNDARPIREADVWENAARNLARQPEKASALAFLARATNVRRGAVQAMQEGLQRMEARALDGRPASMLRERAEGGRRRTRDLARQQRAMQFRHAVAKAGSAVRAAVERMAPAARNVVAFVRPAKVEGRKPRARM